MKKTLFAIFSICMLAFVVGSTSFVPTVRAFDDRERRSCGQGDRGRLIDFEKVASYPTAAAARAYFYEWIAFYDWFYNFPDTIPGVRFTNGFDSYKVTYCTVDAVLPGRSRAKPTVVTGMVSVPRKSGPLPTVAYVHGTSVSFYDAPSNPNIFGSFEERGESFEGAPGNSVFAGNGFIVIAPDYLGLGDSTVPRHRYFHAETVASASVDLLVASRRVLAKLRVEQNGELFTFGFSQGGHSALALHRALQDAGADVTGTATVGGVFDLERWFLSLRNNTTSVTLPLYLSYIILAYDDVYDIFDKTTDVFQEPYASTVGELFDMTHFFDDILAGLPPDSRALLQPGFFDRVNADPQHPLRVRLRENAVDNWTPYAPIRVFQSRDDEEVPFESMEASVARLRSHGANVSVREASGDHVTSWILTLPRAVNWFRSLE
jgi:pimeloyl-ACP methyl ester carboxylesterase